jgi:hypothetical protein
LAEEVAMPPAILSWLRRHWALVLAGLLVIFVAGGVSVSRLAPQRVAAPPAVSSSAR